MNGRLSLAFWLLLVLLVWSLAGCDREPTKLDLMTEAATAPAPRSSASNEPMPAASPAAPSPPAISVTDIGCTINGEEVLFINPDARDRIAALVADKPLVVGNVVTFEAAREAKVPHVTAVVSALRKAKAKAAAIRTPKRDDSTGELLVTFAHGAPSACTPVAMILRDGSIAVWGAGGGVAQKFAKGLAGPDLSLSTAGLRKASAACGSTWWVLGADDNITWGLTFDLAIRAREDSEGGRGLRATETVLADEAPIAGRKVTVP